MKAPGSEPSECRKNSLLRRVAGRSAIQSDILERRQRAAVERGGQSGASRVGDLGRGAEVDKSALSFFSPPVVVRSAACRRRRRQESGEALVAERVASKNELLQRGQPPQGRVILRSGRAVASQREKCEN